MHLIGASIGARRMAVACRLDADARFFEPADGYIIQDFKACDVSHVVGARLDQRLGGRAHEVLAHPTRRPHMPRSRGRPASRLRRQCAQAWSRTRTSSRRWYRVGSTRD